MRHISVIALASMAMLLFGCESQGTYSPLSTANPANINSQNCVPLTQLIAFSGTATLTSSSAISDNGSAGQLGLGVVTSVVNNGNSQSYSYSGTSSDGAIQFNGQEGVSGPGGVQGYLLFSTAAWNQALSQWGDISGLCVQAMSFDLEVASGSGSQQTLFGGQVTLTVSGSRISLAF